MFDVPFNSPIGYTIAGRYIKITFSTVTYFNKLVKSKTQQFTKYSMDLNCGKQLRRCFGQWSRLQCRIPARRQECNVTIFI